MENENPSYYAIIPAEVRYDKRLKANEKLMYGEITCLSNKKGYCFSSNSYFAELYGVTPQAISGWIKNLEKCGYVTCEYLHNGTEIKERRIRIVKDTNSTNDEKGNSTKLEKGINKSLKGYKQKFKDNNTSDNNMNNNNTSITDKPKKEKSDYTIIFEIYYQNFQKLYEQGKVETEKPLFSYKVACGLIKDLLKKISRDDIIKCIDKAILDSWIVEQGYSITTILSANQVNKLLNAKPQNKTFCKKTNEYEMPTQEQFVNDMSDLDNIGF